MINKRKELRSRTFNITDKDLLLDVFWPRRKVRNRTLYLEAYALFLQRLFHVPG